MNEPVPAPVAAALPTFRDRLDRLWGRHGGWLVPLLAALLPLLWLARDASLYIYGQDSQSFLQPFAISHDPLYPYSYDYSQSYPIPFYVSGFYATASILLLQTITGSPVGSERILLFGFAALGALGMWDLLRLTGTRWFGPSAGGPLRRGLVVAFYLVNPFTLTVVWWHVEGWTENYVFLPWLLGALLLIYWEGRLSWARGSLVVLLSLLLAQGVGGAFGIPIGYLFLVVILGLSLRAVRDRAVRRTLPRAFATLGTLGVAMLAWTSIPFLLTPNPGYSSNTYVNAQNLDAMFHAESQYTVPWNTFRMLGFSWIYAAPNAYPWIGWLLPLAVAGTLGVFAYLVGVVWLRRYPGFGLLWLGTLLLLVLSFGDNPPLGGVDLWLLNRHGPFLLLVDPYYLILEPWVIMVCLAVFVWLASPPKAAVEELRSLGRWLRSLGPRAVPGAPTERTGPSPTRGFSGPISTAILVLGFVIVAASAAPVVAYGEYATTGPNVDAFPLPPGLPALSSYFAQGFAGAQYRVLAVPMSSEIGVPWTVPSGSFLDTSGLLGSYIPYPVLQEDDGFLPGALMDWFATTPSTNYTEVFEALHLRAVVVDPFAPLGDHSIGTSPDGHPVNWTHVEAVLNASLGTAQDVGGFSVYPVPAAQPFLWLESNLTTVLTPTFGDYLALLANVSASDPLGSYLDDALWTNDSEASPDGLAVTPVVGASTMVDVPWGGSARAMLENGTSVPVPGAEAAAVGVTESPVTKGGAPVHEVTAATPLLASLSNASSYSTDLVAGSSVLTGPTGGNGTFSFRGTFASPILASVNLSLSLHPGGNWATLDLVGTRATVQAQIYENTGTGASTLGLAAFDAAGTPFAWSNAPLPFGSAPLAFTLSVEDSGGVLSAHLRGSGGVPEVNATIWFQGAANLSLDPGHNVSALPPGTTGGDPVAVQLSTVYTGVTLSAFSVHRSEPVVAIAAFAGVNRSTVVPCQLTQGITGSWTVTPEEMTGAPAYLALDLPQFWAWTVSGGPSAPTTPSVSNQSNVFAFDGAVPSGHALTVSFSSPQLPGLVGSLVELAVGSGILAVGLVRRFRSRSSG